MAALKKSEQRLLGIFLVVCLLVISFFLYTQLSKVQRRADNELRRLQLERLEIADLLADKEFWDRRQEWLRQAQPAFTTQEQAAQDLLDTVRGAARSNGIEIESEDLEEPRENEHYQSSVATVKGVADLESVLRWVYQLQTPKDFRAVTRFKLVPEKEDPERVHCEVKVERWYAVAGG